MGTRKWPVSELKISIDIRYQVQLFLLGIFYQIYFCYCWNSKFSAKGISQPSNSNFMINVSSLTVGSEKFKKEREKEVYHRKDPGRETEREGEENYQACNARTILSSVKTLVTNPTFIFLNLAAACEGKLSRWAKKNRWERCYHRENGLQVIKVYTSERYTGEKGV